MRDARPTGSERKQKAVAAAAATRQYTAQVAPRPCVRELGKAHAFDENTSITDEMISDWTNSNYHTLLFNKWVEEDTGTVPLPPDTCTAGMLKELASIPQPKDGFSRLPNGRTAYPYNTYQRSKCLSPEQRTTFRKKTTLALIGDCHDGEPPRFSDVAQG